MKYKIIKNYGGDIELMYDNKIEYLTNIKPFIILTESEYKSIPKHKQYLINDGLVLVEFAEEESKDNKQINKK